MVEQTEVFKKNLHLIDGIFLPELCSIFLQVQQWKYILWGNHGYKKKQLLK